MWLVAVAVAGSPEYEACGNNAKTTFDLIHCDEEETARLEGRLSELLTRASPARQALQQKAHQTWLTFREARCAMPSEDEQLARHNAQLYADCMLGLTTARVDQLEGKAAPPEPEYQRCQKAPVLVDCVTQAHQREDKRLNVVYGQVMASTLPQVDKDWVKKVERAWIPYRDATCAEEAAAQGGGSLAPARCALRMTTEQADWLKLQLPR